MITYFEKSVVSTEFHLCEVDNCEFAIYLLKRILPGGVDVLNGGHRARVTMSVCCCVHIIVVECSDLLGRHLAPCIPHFVYQMMGEKNEKNRK